MLAEIAMFIQLLGMAVIWWFIKGIMRGVCWLIICLVDGKTKANGIKVKKVVNDNN